jgi:gamma-glutamylcyclotransferase (GGCT)/AIG2-like uncharacterized protein YtfP
MKYFAYGSNMNHKQMRQRCPDAIFLKRASLKNYKFVYDGYSKTREGAVANIICSLGDQVWGGLFEVNKDNIVALDYYEDYPNSYDRKKLNVKDEQRGNYRAIVYLREGRIQGKPSKDYREIIVRGAEDCELPKDYIENNLI